MIIKSNLCFLVNSYLDSKLHEFSSCTLYFPDKMRVLQKFKVKVLCYIVHLLLVSLDCKNIILDILFQMGFVDSDFRFRLLEQNPEAAGVTGF